MRTEAVWYSMGGSGWQSRLPVLIARQGERTAKFRVRPGHGVFLFWYAEGSERPLWQDGEAGIPKSEAVKRAVSMIEAATARSDEVRAIFERDPALHEIHEEARSTREALAIKKLRAAFSPDRPVIELLDDANIVDAVSEFASDSELGTNPWIERVRESNLPGSREKVHRIRDSRILYVVFNINDEGKV